MTTANLFGRFDNRDVQALIAEYPLAWVQAPSGDPLDTTLLPMIGVYDGEGRLVELVGHLARRNPLCAAWSADARATFLFRGPEAYISPEHAAQRGWAPTWNYAQLVVCCEITLDDAETEDALDLLTDAVEKSRAAPWDRQELGARYQRMLAAIIGFRARVTAMRGTFKLGQDETPEALRAIIRNLPDPQMRHWMTRFNADRL